MTKKITAALLCLVLVLSLSGCSFAETVGNWLDSIGDMIPNDVELVLGQLTGREEVSAEHEIIFSEGYVNMLKSGVYHIVYSLSDGTEVEIGSNGLRFGSTYPEPAELEGVEPQYDENGNPIEPEIPHEHIVLSDGIYYYIDDNQAKMFTVNPANYKAVPFEISAENIAFAEAGTADFGGKSCRYERYTTDAGNITFYYYEAVLTGMVIEQGGTHTLENITAFNKYVNTALVAMPSTYQVVQYWTGE